MWLGEGDIWPATASEVVVAFESEYRRIYGMAIPDVGVEAVTWRLSAFADRPAVEPDVSAGGSAGAAEASGTRAVVFRRGQDPVDVTVFARDALGVGAAFDGPAVVEERETTTVIRPGWSVEVVPDGSLVATRNGAT